MRIQIMAQRLERITQMVDAINKGRAPTVEDFCRIFEVRQRTVFEDLRMIREQLGLDIEYDRFRQGYVNRDPKKKLPVFDLNEGELFVLVLGRDMLAQYSGTVFEPYLRGALSKIEARLPDTVQVNLGDLQSMVKFQAAAIPSFDRQTFFDANKACEMSMPMEISYFSPHNNEVTERCIEPYKLLNHDGSWYIVGWCRLRNALRYFALHRIQNYKLLEQERFRVKEGLDIDKYLESAFKLEHGDGEQHIKIHFKPAAARYIRERKWHPSQKLSENEDGSCILEFVSQSLDEVKRWILYYGANAEVLEPASLREMLRKEFAEAVELYKD
ncbi:MAG: WYL domain-containing protein [Candidatus Obscuribacterales bacterium]|nr:WYL domain-containing protein [Candidatus Obscuribacterales bacterium]